MGNRQHAAGIAAALGLAAFVGGAAGLSFRPANHRVAARSIPPLPSSLSCGPAALIAAFDSLDDAASRRLRTVLAADARAAQPVSSLLDLVRWAERAGARVRALHLPPGQLDRVRPPFVVHLVPSHFVAVLDLDPSVVEIRDQFGARRLSRAEFDRWFSGAILCLQPSSSGPDAFTLGADS